MVIVELCQYKDLYCKQLQDNLSPLQIDRGPPEGPWFSWVNLRYGAFYVIDLGHEFCIQVNVV